MFIGHYAVALGAKKADSRISLGTLVAAAQWLDLIWPLMLLLGVEHVRVDPGNTAMTPLDFYDYPYTHSLLAAAVWSVLFGAGYFLFRRSVRGALITGGAVFSHWVLDFLTHRPDLPLAPGSSARFGLGLWNSVPGTILVEGLLFIAGIVLYTRVTVAADRIGRYGFWSLAGILAVIYVSNLLGPPPPDTAVIGVAGLIGWLFVFWAGWADRHRKLREPSAVQEAAR